MQDFFGKKIVLGICGSVAAYKSAYLIRRFIELGAEVRVVLTEGGEQFMTSTTLQALSQEAVRTTLFDAEAERAMGHIELARWADYLVIAPASANCIAKMAQGLADDLLSTLYLVAEVPVILCPAMNPSMWKHPATKANTLLLEERGVLVVGPEKGMQACGEEGWGRFSEANAIVSALRLHHCKGLLGGAHVLITAGPTREPIDPVRYLSNRSSGKMGYALAEAACIAGAKVTLISGPTALMAPSGACVHYVETAEEMHANVMEQLQEKMIFIGTAAVADYRLARPAQEKIKRENQEELTLILRKNPDILRAVVAANKASLVVGFAAETQQLIANARTKLISKKLDMIVANHVGLGLGFDQDVNEVTILTSENQHVLPQMHKIRLAGEIIAIIATTLQNRAHTFC